MLRLIAWITGLLTLSLAGFAFVLSFNALADLAGTHGVSVPPLFPLVVEAAVIIFSLNVLYKSLTGQRTRWQWALIIGSSLLAGAFRGFSSKRTKTYTKGLTDRSGRRPDEVKSSPTSKRNLPYLRNSRKSCTSSPLLSCTKIRRLLDWSSK